MDLNFQDRTHTSPDTTPIRYQPCPGNQKDFRKQSNCQQGRCRNRCCTSVVPHITPRVTVRMALSYIPTGCALPLRLRRQMTPRPSAERHGIIRSHADHRVAVSLSEVARSPVLDSIPIIWSSAACRCHKRPILTARHLILADGVGREIYRVLGEMSEYENGSSLYPVEKRPGRDRHHLHLRNQAEDGLDDEIRRRKARQQPVAGSMIAVPVAAANRLGVTRRSVRRDDPHQTPAVNADYTDMRPPADNVACLIPECSGVGNV